MLSLTPPQKRPLRRPRPTNSMPKDTYSAFLDRKAQLGGCSGFAAVHGKRNAPPVMSGPCKKRRTENGLPENGRGNLHRNSWARGNRRRAHAVEQAVKSSSAVRCFCCPGLDWNSAVGTQTNLLEET